MKPENVACPVCRGPMVSRQHGKTGQRFWGCAAYPQCKGTRNTDGESQDERHQRRDDTPRSRRF